MSKIFDVMARAVVVAAACAAFLLVPAAAARTSTSAGIAAAELVPRYGIFEHTFRWPSGGYSNPWEQVNVSVAFTSPSGRRVTVKGFYFAQNTWKTRFSPGQAGRWSWRARIGDGKQTRSFRGAFMVRGKSGHGFVRGSPYNRFRWLFADGTPYYPIGIGDCVRDENGSGSPFDDFHIDGDFSKDTEERSRVNIKRYLSAYQHAAVNLFRWSVDNCAFGLYRAIAPEDNTYLEREGRWGDQFVRELRGHRFRVYMVIFGFRPPYADTPTTDQIKAIHRYVDYIVARYGAYVDYWELMNEAVASRAWYADVAGYLRKFDPYHHPISTSFERADLHEIDINAPHWYERESEFDSDARTWERIVQWRAAGKPVVVGEQGNQGQNWDDRSAVRLRIRSWTAFFAGGTLIFWNTSSRKDYRASSGNIYLGREERSYLRVLQGITRGFDRQAVIAPLRVSSAAVRGYGLIGPRSFAGYLHAFGNHASATSGVEITLPKRRAGTATWINPADGRILRRVRVQAGQVKLKAPSFVIDAALKIKFDQRR